MRVTRTTLTVICFAAAAFLSLVAAMFAVQLVEDTSEIEIRGVLDRNGLTWAEVEADGLRVVLAGTAPTEALRFRALSLGGTVVDAARIVDEMEVVAAADLEPPRFSVEVLRNTSGLSIIGLIPQSSDREKIVSGFKGLVDVKVTDLLETADYPVPAGWEDALAFATNAIKGLPRAKVSVDAGQVEITTIANSAADKATMEAELKRSAPPSLRLSLNITAPRPVITPFAMRFVIDESGPHFDTCSVDTEANQQRILAAAADAGMAGPGRCSIGMGVPSPYWTDAVVLTISALSEIGSGTVTFSNADVTLAAAQGTSEALFDRVIGELETSLPEVFALTATLPAPENDENAGPPEFTATLSPEGQVQLRGRVGSENMREITDSFAKAKFGVDSVYTAARVVPDLPPEWAARILTGIEALAFLNNGFVTVTPDNVAISGGSGNQDAHDSIARLMVDKLGEGSSFDIKVKYVEELDPIASLPTPEECESRIAEIVARGKISFEPGSATIDESALVTMDEIAEVLQDCGDIQLEIQGHTDSQGREEMNLALSQSRAESVLNELRARRVLTGSFIAKGYGETQPLAENDTDEGREANRRIEFKLLRRDAEQVDLETTLESMAEDSETSETEESADD